jgi:hypothetical protein
MHRSLDYFFVFQLQEPKQFFVGCGGGGAPVSYDKANGGSNPHMGTITIMEVMAAGDAYYQLRDTYNDATVASVVVLSVLAIFIFVLDFFGHLFTKSCFYGICTAVCLGSVNGRLGIYRWLKKKDSSFAYCDEFKPDQLQLDDHSKEAIVLFDSIYVWRDNVAVIQIPNWKELRIDVERFRQMYMGELVLDMKKVQLNRRLGGSNVNFWLYWDVEECSVVFQMVNEGKTILARSTYDKPRGRTFNDSMTTEVSLDEHA